MSTQEHSELTKALVVALASAQGKWVALQSAAPALSCVGRVVALDPNAAVVVLETQAGGRRTTVVSLFVAIELFGPVDQLRLNTALAELQQSAGRMLQ